MNNEAGHKRKEFTQKSKSAFKRFWFNWFGDIHPFKPISRKIVIVINSIKKSMKKIIIISSLILGGTIGLIFSNLIIQTYKEYFPSPYVRSIRQLQEVAIELNNECPKNIDKNTVSTSVYYNYPESYDDFSIFADTTHGITYNYDLKTIINRKEFVNQRKIIINSYCSDTLYAFFRENNFYMEYNYNYRHLSRQILAENYDCDSTILAKINSNEYQHAYIYHEVKMGESMSDIMELYGVLRHNVRRIALNGRTEMDELTRVSKVLYSVDTGDILSIYNPL